MLLLEICSRIMKACFGVWISRRVAICTEYPRATTRNQRSASVGYLRLQITTTMIGSGHGSHDAVWRQARSQTRGEGRSMAGEGQRQGPNEFRRVGRQGCSYRVGVRATPLARSWIYVPDPNTPLAIAARQIKQNPTLTPLWS